MLRPLCLFLALFSLLTLARPAPCQTTDFVAALSGDKHPLTLKLKDLDSSWRRVSTAGSGEATNQMEMYLAMLTGGAENIYYTRGETAALGGEIYLIAYHHPVSVNYAALMHGSSDMPPLPKITPETTLSLCLLSLRSLGSLRDIQPFSMTDALKPPVANGALGSDATSDDINQASVSNLKQIGLALLQYTQDFDEVLPPMKTVAESNEAIYPYLKNKTLLEHPGTHELYQTNTSLSHRRLASFDSPATMVTYYEASPDSDGLRAVLFLDGHVKRVTEAEWQQLKTASHVPNPAPAKPVPKGG